MVDTKVFLCILWRPSISSRDVKFNKKDQVKTPSFDPEKNQKILRLDMIVSNLHFLTFSLLKLC